MRQRPAVGTGAPAPATAPATSRHDQHFATNHLIGDLKRRSIRGGAVTLTSQAIKFALQMGSTVVLARLLLPSDFGLIAMVTAITGFVTMFKDAGLSMATVQRNDITHDQISTLFWINVALSAAVMLVVGALAPAIAAFYSEPRLVWITLALAGTMLFGGFTVQHQALLQRQMRFKALAVVEIASMAGGIAFAITMALMGCRYWSLVGMVAGTALINALLVWVLCDWRPGLPRRHSGVRPMLGFGGNLTGAAFANYLSQNLDKILIGRLSTAALLGAYTKSYQLIMMPLRQLNAPVGQVAIPALSRMQTDGPRYRRAFLRMQRNMALLVGPLLGFLVPCADWIVMLVLGDQWAEAIPYFAILSGIAIVQAVLTPAAWLWTTQGRTGELFRWTIFDSVTTAVAVSIGITWGALGVAIAFSGAGLLKSPIFIWAATRRGPVQGLAIWKNAAAAFGLATVIAITILGLRATVEIPSAGIGAVLGGATYGSVIIVYLAFSRTTQDELKDLSRWVLQSSNRR